MGNGCGCDGAQWGQGFRCAGGVLAQAQVALCGRRGTRSFRNGCSPEGCCRRFQVGVPAGSGLLGAAGRLGHWVSVACGRVRAHGHAATLSMAQAAWQLPGLQGVRRHGLPYRTTLPEEGPKTSARYAGAKCCLRSRCVAWHGCTARVEKGTVFRLSKAGSLNQHAWVYVFASSPRHQQSCRCL